MSRGTKLLAMLGLLVMLLVATVAVKLAAEPADDAAAETVYALQLDSTAVTALSWEKGGSTLSFQKTDGSWTFPADKSFPVRSSAITTLLDSLTAVTVEKTVEGDAASFGLTAPTCVITWADDSTHTVTIGSESPLGGQRYMTVDDSPVYLVDDGILTDFTTVLYDYLQAESIPTLKNVTALTLQREDGTLKLTTQVDAESNTLWYGTEKKQTTELDATLTESFLDGITSMYWTTTVEHNAGKKALQTYGLDEPTAVLTVKYQTTTQVATDLTDSDGVTIMEDVTTDHSFVLELGSSTESGCYARLAGSKMVYELSATFADDLLQITMEDLLPTEE